MRMLELLRFSSQLRGAHPHYSYPCVHHSGGVLFESVSSVSLPVLRGF